LAPTIEVLRSVARNFNDSLGADQGTRHAPPDLTNDIEALMESLDDNNVYRFQKGRLLGEDTGGAVKDVVLVGLLSLTAGKKTPLTDYNDAFKRLQRRRRMMSVEEQAKLLSQTTPPMASPVLAQSRREIQPAENEVVYNVASVGLYEEEEEPTEIQTILDDIANEVAEPTLERLNEEDVSLDMDEVVVEVIEEEDEWESSNDEDSDDSRDDGEVE
jgi:hypothetical protein